MKVLTRIACILFLFCHAGGAWAQATIAGKVVNELAEPLAGVSIVQLGNNSGVSSSDSGTFTIKVRSGRALALVFSYAGYRRQQINFYLSPSENEYVLVKMEPGDTSTLQQAVVTNKRNERLETGLVSLNPKMALQSPAPITGVENLIKVLVGSNNELSSQYNVRGGSYDENLVYVNDFEIFRPYLIRNGQQEGLSFINPALARNVNFYNGGFQARFGDKMSSVLDVEYKRPKAFHGSAYLGLLEQGLHVEGSLAKEKVTYLAGVRNRSLRNLLSAQETKGNYLPSSGDIQGQITWKPNEKWDFELLANMSNTTFSLEPQESQQTTSVFTPLYSANLGLDVFYTGNERDQYRTRMAGVSATRHFSKNFRLKGMLSYFGNKEAENINIAGDYLFGEREFDKNSDQFGLIVNPLGAGAYLQYARNTLDVNIWNATLRGVWQKGNHYLQFGSSIEWTKLEDELNEFEMRDSAGYSLPFNTGPLFASSVLKGSTALNYTRLSGFIQDNLRWSKWPGVTVQAGLRYNYNTLNNELLISPRAGISFSPQRWQKDIIFKASAGLYHQPPFYREMRRYDGTVNTDLLAQRSWQISTGMDYAFSVNKRPYRWTTELYYKNMDRVVPYDIDNVRLRYFGENMAKAYAYGAETRLFGEIVKDAESWVSLGFMKTMENLNNDFYFNYYNADGELITSETIDQVPKDSARVDVGWLRRPTDRRINVGVFFSDYLTTNKNFKVYVQTLFGTNMPYNIPGSVRYRNALEIPPYLRVDLGLTYQLVGGEKYIRRSHDPFRHFSSMWLSLEVFNLLDRDNVISYALIKDFANNTYAIPNRLTPRLINLKLSANW